MKNSILLYIPILLVNFQMANAQWGSTTSTTTAIQRTGTVGIGTTTLPTVKLEVNNGNTTLPSFLKVDPDNANVLMSLQNTSNNSNATLFDIRNKRASGGTTNGGWSGMVLTYDATVILPETGINSSSFLLKNDDLFLSYLQFDNYNSARSINNSSKLIELDANAGNKYARTSLSTQHATHFRWEFDGSEKMRVMSTGQVAIGTTTPGTFALAVEGKIGAREIQVLTTSPFPDYVFESNYRLRGLNELELYIRQNKHLPEFPSAEEVKANGLALGEMNTLLVKKVEELTLYLIDQENKNTEHAVLLQEQHILIKELQQELKELKKKVK